VSALPHATELNVISSPFGHDGFLIEIDQVAPIIKKALDKAVASIK
jgi:homoserine O-acetyltransferase